MKENLSYRLPLTAYLPLTALALVFLLFTNACQKEEKKDNTASLIGILALSGGGSSAGGTSTGTTTLAPTLTSFTPTSGPINSTVTITGTNFSSSATSNVVKFNGTVATVTAATSTQLTVTVPTGTTTGKISIEVSGQLVTSTTDFTIACNPCRIFITATTSNGNLGGVTGAQAKCDADANKPTTGTFKVYLKASNGTSSGNIVKDVKYTRVDGTVIVNTAFAGGYLVDPNLPSSTNVTNTISTTSSTAWIGYSGTSTGGNCVNWTSSSALAIDGGFYISPNVGTNANQIGDGAVSGGNCTSLRSLICIEQ
ncbi:MAG: IPT/TIG domain-containing protein [Leptospiraceae bacterium]|nr:IPT/TIG domain-containing protein [Leptospiraceae bacterium]